MKGGWNDEWICHISKVVVHMQGIRLDVLDTEAFLALISRADR